MSEFIEDKVEQKLDIGGIELYYELLWEAA